MKRKNLLFSTLLALCGSMGAATAQTAYPYFPESNVKANLAPVATSVADPSTLVVDQATDFTLEVNGTANTPIRIANGLTAYNYTPATTATVRFVKKGTLVYVYENAVYKAAVTAASQYTFPNVRQVADDSVGLKGIYSPLNLLANPGFERRVSQGSTTHFKDGIYWNAYNSSKALDWSTGTTAAIRSGTNRSEGNWSIIIHGSTRYLTQKLPTLEPNTYYQISYDYWTSSGSGNGGGLYTVQLGHTEFGTNITTFAGPTTVEGDYTQKNFTGMFKTPASFSGTDFWLTLYRSNSRVDWMDRLTLLKTTTTNTSSGIEGVTGTALYVSGTAYGPAVTLNATAGDYFEMTPLVTNPNFESSFTGWTSNGMVTQTNTSFGAFKSGNTYVEKYVGTAPLPDASVTQTVTGLPNGLYTLKAAGQNLLENPAPATGKSGAFLFGNTTPKAVTDRNEYTFSFLVLEGKADIGFKLVNSQANWAAVDNFRLQYKGFSTSIIKDSLQVLKDSANRVLGKKMQNAVRTTLAAATDGAQDAINNATITNDALSAVYVQLQNAISTALVSVNAYNGLQVALDSAVVVYGAGTGNGAAALMTAIQRNQTLAANLDATLAAINAGTAEVYAAIYNYRLANPSGPLPVVTTNPQFARGATMAFGRSTVIPAAGTSVVEQGFCWSTSASPTIFDNKTTKFISRNGNLYWIENLQPATVYYMRAYAISNNYAVGYGNVLKVITIPKGTVTYQLNSSVVNSGEHYPRIASAMASAVDYFNNLTSIQGHRLSVNYNSGTPTAEASYGGYMQFGASSSYQRTGTALHEMGHTIGVGQHSMWYGPNSPLRSGGNTGNWLGERANQVVKFLENNPAEYMRGDGTHMWPYGVNGAHEDNGTDLLYVGNALIHQALGEDGLPPTGGFATPAYTFNQEDTTKYYIKIESELLGRSNTYLAENELGLLVNKLMLQSTASPQDSAAWYFKFNPATGFYQIQNVATGKYFTYQLTGPNGITLTQVTTPAAAQAFQLMGQRGMTTIGVEGNSYKAKSYWIVRPANTTTPPVLGATPAGITEATTMNNRDTAATQRWLLLTRADVDSIQRVQATILPVTLTQFTAKAVGSETKLAWATATETNSRRFEVERSNDGVHFRYIGEVAAQGNTTTAKAYALTDKQPQAGSNFYRLKQIDNNGKATYSPVRIVDFGVQAKGISLFPNPASSYLYIKGLDQATEYTYTVYTTNGQTIANGKLAGAKLGLPKLSDASYILQLFENGKKVFTQGFLIRK